MNRRQFLKRIVAAAVAVPIALVAAKKEPAIKAPWVRLNTQYYGERKCVTTTELAKMDEYDAWHKFNVFHNEAARLKYRKERGLSNADPKPTK